MRIVIFLALLSVLFNATAQRRQLKWSNVMLPGTPNKVAGWDGSGNPVEVTFSGGDMVLSGVQTSTGKKTFQGNSSAAGINIGSQAGNPSVIANGDAWINTTVSPDVLYAQIEGVIVPLNIVKSSFSLSGFDFPNTAAGAQSRLTGVVTAAVGDPVTFGFANVPSTDGVYYAYISGVNQITIVFTNTSAGAIDPPSQGFNVIIFNR